jgi:hypothetical protein
LEQTEALAEINKCLNKQHFAQVKQQQTVVKFFQTKAFSRFFSQQQMLLMAAF